MRVDHPVKGARDGQRSESGVEHLVSATEADGHRVESRVAGGQADAGRVESEARDRLEMREPEQPRILVVEP